MNALEAGFAAELDALCEAEFRDEKPPVLVASSGGGDSTALLVLAARFFGPDKVCAGSVNHNLRAEASQEIAAVSQLCDRLCVAHLVRDWHWDGQGNLQARARAARQERLLEMADASGAEFILLGHTAEDQAETVLLRLARGSGVDGLAAMAGRDGIWLRPLLMTTRAELREFLRHEGISWTEDPSNDDPRFDRVRARGMAETLADLGLDRARLVKTADLMRAEAAALHFGLKLWAGSAVTARHGILEVDRAAFNEAPAALVDRLLAYVVRWYSGAVYKPRRDELATWRLRIASGKPAPLGGVLAQAPSGQPLRLWREPAAIAGAQPVSCHLVSTRWDHRWAISAAPEIDSDLTIAALGEAWKACPASVVQEMPKAALVAQPAIWRKDQLIAAPAAGLQNGWTATLRPSFAEFLDIH